MKYETASSDVTPFNLVQYTYVSEENSAYTVTTASC